MGKKAENLKKNYFASTLSLIVSIIIPLATTPYVSRILKENGIGQYTFAYSIISYFLIFASLGFGIYSSREIARFKDDSKKVSIVFWDVFFAKLMSSAISLGICLLLYFLGVYGKYSVFILIASLEIFTTGIDISFLFVGLEKFSILAFLNTFFRSIGLVCVYLFVKTEADTWIYCLCVSGPFFISAIAMWVLLPKYVQRIPLSSLAPFKRFWPSLKLFVPAVATTIYTTLDKTLIGALAANPDYSNGCYEQAYKIVSTLYTFCSAVTPIMAPRNSFDYEKGHLEQIKNHIDKSIQYIFLFAVPIFFGIQVLANNLCGWFLGSGFSDSPNLLRILSGMILIASLTFYFGSGLLVPMKRDSWYTICVCCGAGLNAILDSATIPFFGSYGAAGGTLISEFLILCLMMYDLVRRAKIFTLKHFFSLLYKYLISGLVMFLAIYFLFPLFPDSMWTFFVIVVIGASIYFLVLFFEKDSLFLYLLRWGWNKIFRRRKTSDKEV